MLLRASLSLVAQIKARKEKNHKKEINNIEMKTLWKDKRF